MWQALWLSLAALTLNAADFNTEIAKFRAGREKNLRAEDGWLSLVGLTWLNEGDNRLDAGTFTLKSGHVYFQPAAGVKLKAQELKPDKDVLVLDSKRYMAIQRGKQTGVRIKDSESPARKEFTGLRWYPPDPSWRFVAKFTPYDKPHKLTFDTVIDGLQEEDQSPGYVTFTRNGREYKLEPVVDEGELFFVFRDQTSGKSTYAAARFLYTSMPKNGTVVLDFNRAENPPCVFTPYATCPLPPPQNRLPLEVAAGELMYNGHH